MGSSLSAEVLELIDNRLEYQVAVSSQQFSADSSVEDLTCMNCMRMEMGELSFYTHGICDMCGEVPPSLQWMYPGSSSRGQIRTERSRRRRRTTRQEQPRSTSSDRPRAMTQASTYPRNRRNQRRGSADNVAPGRGLSPGRIERSSFKQTYSITDVGDKESTQCVICITDFQPGTVVRRLACLHLFHTGCVDAWLKNNR